jgi:hypothetical protein
MICLHKIMSGAENAARFATAFALLLATFGAPSAHAGEVKAGESGGLVYDVGVDGMEIEWNNDGTMKRVSSTWRHPVVIPDRPGISKAQVIAEEKAKAAIVRYMNQMSSSERLVTEISDDVSSTVAKTNDGQVELSTEAKRKIGESLRETTRSFAQGRLRGVIVLEKGFNPKSGEVWVTVGLSEKTMAASAKLAEAINSASGETSRTNSSEPSSAKAATVVRGGALMPQEGEVRRSRTKDW